MNAILSVLDFLKDRYLEQEIGFKEFRSEDTEGVNVRTPRWFWATEDLDQSTESTNHAALLDPELGVIFFFLTYQSANEIENPTDVRAQIAKAIGLRSKLMPRRAEKNRHDKHGSWKVVLHWLVEANDAEQWQESASEIRRTSAHLEEVPIDAIIFSDPHLSWDEAIHNHGLPRLMFCTRKVLGKTSVESVFEWTNANEKVRNALRDFSDSFNNPSQKKIAKSIEDRALKGTDNHPTPISVDKTHNVIRSVSISSFRNIKDIQIEFGRGDDLQPAIVHGPNGSGKSNIFEAIEFGLRGTSSRAQEFSSDPDVTTTRKAQEYREKYISPFDDEYTSPEVLINGEDSYIHNDSSTVRPPLDGNMLTQDQAADFVQQSASGLATKILGEFSGLADELIRYVDQESERTASEKTKMLANLGIPQAGRISKPQTARLKLAEKVIRDRTTFASDRIARLSAPALSWSPITKASAHHSSNLRVQDTDFKDITSALSMTKGREETGQRLFNFFTRHQSSRQEADQFLSSQLAMRAEWPSNLDELVSKWGSWLEEHSDSTEINNDEEIIVLRKFQEALNIELADLERAGHVLSKREQHFSSIDSFLTSSWKTSGHEKCPTCDTDLSDRGGAIHAIQQVRSDNLNELQQLRQKYAKKKQELQAVAEKLNSLDTSKCPLSEEQIAGVRKALAIHIPADTTVEQIITPPELRSACTSWVHAVQQLPAPEFAQGFDAEETASYAAEQLLEQFDRLESGFELPESWKAVSKKLKNRLAKIVEDHLPSTLGGLWKELVMCITPAPWQMLGRLDMHVSDRRGKQEARLELKDKSRSFLARYVLNKAETHALGLGWFFTRYLTQGRFECSLLALDDPALDMDQTTYRDLCRLLESLQRLHQKQSIPLSMLIMLHQDERALDAARATRGVLHRLTWNAHSAKLAKSLEIYGPEMINPLPSLLWDKNEQTQNIH